MASSAVLALMSAGALTAAQAQKDPALPVIVQEQPAAAAQPATDKAAPDLLASEAALTPEQPTLASVFIGRSVYSSEDPESDNIGDVNDLIVSEDGTITHAVIGVGGFLGMGEKDVAVPFDELELVEREGDIRLIYAATREQLEAAPALDRTAFDPIARFAEEQAAAVDSSVGLGVPAGDMMATPPPAPTEEMAAVPAENVAPAAAELAEAPPPVPVEKPAEDLAAAPLDETLIAPADEQMAAVEPAPALPGDIVFLSFSPEQIRATSMLGKSVYGPEGESIGEISDLVLQEDGETRAALIDVGGFLGVGAKTVAIAFTEIQISAGEEGMEPLLVVSMAREQLEQLPAIELPAVEAAALEEPLVPDAAMPADGEQVAGTDTLAAPTGEEIVTGSVGSTEAAYEPATQNLSASQLIGSTVYVADDSTIGEVGDVIFDQTGAIEGVEIDVGGFLGFGEKPVAVGLDALSIQADANGNLLVVVNATTEQLESAPVYEEIAADEAASVE